MCQSLNFSIAALRIATLTPRGQIICRTLTLVCAESVQKIPQPMWPVVARNTCGWIIDEGELSGGDVRKNMSMQGEMCCIPFIEYLYSTLPLAADGFGRQLVIATTALTLTLRMAFITMLMYFVAFYFNESRISLIN